MKVVIEYLIYNLVNVETSNTIKQVKRRHEQNMVIITGMWCMRNLILIFL